MPSRTCRCCDKKQPEAAWSVVQKLALYTPTEEHQVRSLHHALPGSGEAIRAKVVGRGAYRGVVWGKESTALQETAHMDHRCGKKRRAQQEPGWQSSKC